MKNVLALLLIVVIGGVAIAEEGMRHHDGPGADHRDMFAAEYESILAEYRDRSPASLTFGQIEDLMADLSVPAQKMAYVKSSAFASMLVPGLGQFKNGDALAGALFFAGNLAIVAGTAVGLYYLLPPELRFDALDYLDASKAEIRTAWETAEDNATLREALPFMGVATGGFLLQQIVAHISARHAAALATENIRNGSVIFTPRVGMMMGPMGHMSLGMGFRY